MGRQRRRGKTCKKKKKLPEHEYRTLIFFIWLQADATQTELMCRTAAHVVRAANDAQLRARILAHHGADARFAFLRGRWGRAWARAQANARREVLAEQEAQEAGALGGLTGYGSGSESEGEGEDEPRGEDRHDTGGAGDSDDSVRVVTAQAAQELKPEEPAVRTTQEARRAKAREWIQKRRAERAAGVDNQQQTDISSNLSPSQESLFSV